MLGEPLRPQPKPKPHKLLKERAKGQIKAIDDRERVKCHVRSGGRCEVLELKGDGFVRCPRRVSQNHHLMGGVGRRNKGASILMAHRLDVCAKCHGDLTGNVLVPVDGVVKHLAAKVKYERIRL